ncbi:MAG: thiamine-phosphate kinase [Vulcanimicrobiaceae bacterium]
MRAVIGASGGKNIVLSIGDDAAAWKPSRSHVSVITTDALVEGVHFRREQLAPDAIGHRAMASNLSDIAAMGARPVLATVALGLPPGTETQDLLEMYRGLNALARASGTTVVGGDITRAPALTLSITVVGEVRPTRLRARSGGRPGDVLAVTGPLGASRAGLDAFDHAGVLTASLANEALQKYARPSPRLREGHWLGASRSVHAMMDLSDGIARDVPRLANASACAAQIDALPIARSALDMAAATGNDSLTYVCEAGEDFELLVAIAPRAFGHLEMAYRRRFGSILHRIGVLESGQGVRLQRDGALVPLEAAGWDHLKPRA